MTYGITSYIKYILGVDAMRATHEANAPVAKPSEPRR
jgi:hypothetical protein